MTDASSRRQIMSRALITRNLSLSLSSLFIDRHPLARSRWGRDGFGSLQSVKEGRLRTETVRGNLSARARI